MNNKVLDIWSILKSEKQVGLTKRLYSANTKIVVYCIYQYPEDCYGIALSFPKSIKFNLDPFSSVLDPIVEIYKDGSFEDCMLLCAKIKHCNKINEFSYLCENVIKAIFEEKTIADAVQTFGNTLLRWKNLFECIRCIGLSKEEQQGLYGELRFLKKCLNFVAGSYYSIVYNYVGPNKSLRDFQGKDWAVEVKTTSTNNPQSLIINGERQLDDTMVNTLFLYHCSVEVSKQTGETLPEIVNSIKEILIDDVAAYSLFSAKLFEAGYVEEQIYLYTSRHYQLRKDSYYHVKDTFPRIRENELREGVGNVKYFINISSFESYGVTEQEVLSKCMCDD